MVVYAYYFTDARMKGYVKYLVKRGLKIDVLALKEHGKRKLEKRKGHLLDLEKALDFVSLSHL